MQQNKKIKIDKCKKRWRKRKMKKRERRRRKKIDCQLIYVGEMTEFEKPTFSNHQCKNWFRKDHQGILKPMGARLWENRISTWPQIITLLIISLLINYKGQTHWGNLAGKLYITNNVRNWHYMPPDVVQWEVYNIS